MAGGPIDKGGPRARLFAVLAVTGIVTIALLGAYLLVAATAPCCAAGLACGTPHRPCPGTSAPPAVTWITAGTQFELDAKEFFALEFAVDTASSVVVNGTFDATRGAAVDVMSPRDYLNFSASPATYVCAASTDCFSSGWALRGELPASLPTTAQGPGNVIEPIYNSTLVQWNPNGTTSTVVAWPYGMTISYFDYIS
jgi:hypothetical protein